MVAALFAFTPVARSTCATDPAAFAQLLRRTFQWRIGLAAAG